MLIWFLNTCKDSDFTTTLRTNLKSQDILPSLTTPSNFFPLYLTITLNSLSNTFKIISSKVLHLQVVNI